MILNNPFYNAFGLEIGDREIKAVQLMERWLGFGRRGYRVKFQERFSLPPEAIVNGEIQKPEIVIAGLKTHLFRKGRPHLKSPWVVASLPETKTFLKVITLKMPLREFTEEIIPGVAATHLPFALEEVYLDWQILTKDKNAREIEIMLGAVTKRIADSYTYLLNIAGMTPLALEMGSLALARSLINHQNPPQGEAVGILDIGWSHSGFMVFDRGVVQFSLSLPFAGIKMEEKIAAQSTNPAAEKMETGLAEAVPTKQKIIKALLAEELDDSIKRIEEAIRFYKTYYPRGSRLKSILVSGDYANLPSLEKILSLKLHLRARRADPTVNFGASRPLPAHIKNTALATAIGLAMRALEKPFNSRWDI